MSKKLSIAVVQGGPSSEAEVSRASATSVARGLAAAGHRVVRLELNPFLAESIRSGGYELVFPVSHGAVGEDGSLQGLIEVLELPYVGSDVLASALAMNKRVAKLLFANVGLPIAAAVDARRGGDATALALARRAIAELGARVVVKPCSNGSAIGVARFDDGATEDALAKAIEGAWAVDDRVLVERFAPGREVTCGVLDEGEAKALPPTEIQAPKDAFYTYEARYAPGRSNHVCPAPFEPALVARIQEVAVGAHRALGCRDLSRVDFVIDPAAEPHRQVTLLEVNTMPGFTDTSLYPEAAGVMGIPMPELCDRLAMAAWKRGPTRRNAALPLPK